MKFISGYAIMCFYTLGIWMSPDGGFGHSIDLDCQNPHSQPIQFFWGAAEILAEIGYNMPDNPVMKRFIKYIENCPDITEHGIRFVIPSNNDWIFLLSIKEVVKYFGDSGQLKNKNIVPDCDWAAWCKDEFFFFIGVQYNLTRRAVDNAGIIWTWRLRSPGANERYVANVLGDCRDNMDHGDISVSGDIGYGGVLIYGHMIYDGSGFLTKEFGVRPALWLSDL